MTLEGGLLRVRVTIPPPDDAPAPAGTDKDPLAQAAREGIARVLGDFAEVGLLAASEDDEPSVPDAPEWFCRLPAVEGIVGVAHPIEDDAELVRIVVESLIANLRESDRRIASFGFGLDAGTANLSLEDRLNSARQPEPGISKSERRARAVAPMRFRRIRAQLADVLYRGSLPRVERTDEVVVRARVAEIEAGLDAVKDEGLPVTPDLLTPGLLLLCGSANRDNPARAAEEVDALIHAALARFEVVNKEWARAARILFAYSPRLRRPRNLMRRRAYAAATLAGKQEGTTMNPHSFRHGAEVKIVAALAWKLYRMRFGEDSAASPTGD